MAYTRIGVAQARELIEKSNATVVDVRDPASYEAGHIPGAKAVNEANVQAFVQAADRFHPLIVCCYHGNLSQGAADYFNQNGFADTYTVWTVGTKRGKPPQSGHRSRGASVPKVLPSSSVGEESLSPNHPDTSSRF